MKPSATPRRLLHEALLEHGADPARARHTAVVVEGRAYSYAQLLDTASRLAGALAERGVGRGDRVAIYMDNTWPCVVAVFATLLAGGVFLVVNPLTKSDKLGFVLDDSGARVLLSDGHLAHEFVPLLGTRPALRVIASGGLPDRCAIEAFDAVIEAAAPLCERPATIALDLAALIYTSGSTGMPKGVMHTHQSMLFAAQSLIQYLRLGEGERILCTLPLAFDYGLYQWLMAVQLGATLVLERSFAFPAQVFARMHAFEVTVFPGVPTVFAMLLSAHRRERLCFPSVTRVTNTAAALPDEQALKLREIFPSALLYKMYGLTECKRVCYLEPELMEAKPGSVGKAIPGTEVFLRSVAGGPVAPGEAGILHVRGPHVMLGYWNRPDLSAQMLREGPLPGERVLCTHDWFRMDEEGFLYFVGRSDDIIKTRGEKVSPVEVENVLHAVEGVREAAVVGVPDELLGEAIRAYVVLESGVSLGVGQIRAYCMRRLESFMVPQQILLCMDLPRTATGKVSRKALLEQPPA
ncbi:MAG TPA: class I adenylate-forming enzyme family protein [Frateuria sp.]|uniref:class I adenylate-forming enzyme family protein n=1 Tax=Frateuria sp. TaxID=2211372 RepID=UPI002DE54F7F|nr:class I adenylate-forming enzyme family protein [Frateuria sp.]